MKMLLLGKNGQVGRALGQTLLSLGELVKLGRDNIDLVNLSKLRQILEAYAPQIIVNAAAYTAVDQAENEEETAFKINAKAVEVMANYARQKSCLLVHYSTDYVFDGDKLGSYVETDVTHPLSVYGQSKRAGEEAILQSGCHAIIFRTSWVFSSYGSNFIKTILRLAHYHETLNVINDQYGAPTSAGLIAEITALAIKANLNFSLAPGIYHLSAAGKTSWYELAKHVVQRAWDNNAKLKLKANSINPILSKDYSSPAVRPKNSLLNTEKISNALDRKFTNWVKDVEQVVDVLTFEQDVVV